MKLNYIFLILLLIFPWGKQGAHAQNGQRHYKNNSVLAKGSWYKLAITAPGIYKIDIPFLNNLGINTQQLLSAKIRLFGNGGQLLGEPNSTPRYDDLPEVALYAADGGDGYLNGNDYMLFYAPGPHRWDFNSTWKTFTHQYNLYSDTAWYYINTDEDGVRVQADNSFLQPGVPEYTFDYHAFYERDSLNFLNSGKQWWGQEFSKVLGLSRTYNFTLPAAPVGPVSVSIRAAARSSSGCNFNVTVNNAAAGNIYLLPVTDNIFEGVATAAAATGTAVANQSQLVIGVDFAQGNINDHGWLDYLEVQARCPLVMPAAGPLDFRSSVYVGSGQNTSYVIHNVQAQTKIWDVTDALHPVAVNTVLQGDSLLFTGKNEQLHEYLAFNSSDAGSPAAIGKVPNQDLHGSSSADMIIITTTALRSQAERLAAWHRAQDQLTVQVTTMDQVYNEFASGSPDPTAIRDYVKMFYDRGPAPRYLLLFGAASYDYRQRVKNNTNDVPSWQSDASLDAIRSYVSDDYFGILNDQGDITRTDIPNLLDIGIGRIPARNLDEATLAVNKIIRYRQSATFGAWRNQVTFLADDGDNNLHFNAAEMMSSIIEKNNHLLNIDKIYLDAYPQVVEPTGTRSPEVNKAIDSRIDRGTLILNYSGHGSNSRLAEETVIDAGSTAAWHNENKLPLFITATCDFAPFDDPGITSLGHKVLLQNNGGAIALMTTTRAVFAYSNQVMNANYLKTAFTPQADSTMPALGTAARLAKNITYSSSGDVINNRKFQLLGDPALTLAFPQYRVITDTINGRSVLTGRDTLKGLGHYTIKGHIADAQGNAVTDYNGTLFTTVYDQPSDQKTRGNTPQSQVAAYSLQRNALFQGTQTVTNGQFTVTFVVPKDLNPGEGNGKISYYTNNDTQDGNGYFNNFTTGGLAAEAVADTTGPAIAAWLDKRNFRSGDITGHDPLLIVDLADSSGINISGNSGSYQIIAILDNSEYFVLNDYFEASLNSYRRGSILFPLRGLSTGEHQITIKAWDTYNNAAGATIHFKVAEPDILAVEEVGNYPNPFHDITRFTFLHNQQGVQLQLTLQVFALDGRLVKTMRSTIISTAGRFDGMPWDGRGDAGAKLSPGLYIYRLTIAGNGNTRIKGGKLVLL
ncbi:putative secreted protein (Por secretion system target) [Chitinophaga niastensis]|uniref:Putative secreted protein (Por secretion system target) n=1 Tax=Chitinophaga niastensis TaxID=536980 RepID=A0A2P8HRJ9_CHINA|nr:type IX secretion system sortase PorU [Chitinophaga niastensis]PSL48851.1 putative secreted protein (Por secretion system target) [Chitinophaga niastensis]